MSRFYLYLILSIFISACTEHETVKKAPLLLKVMPNEVINKHALLIGIENYREPIPALNGALNDIALTKNILHSRFGFQDIIILLDEQATHTGIENAFKELTERLNPDDFVYIHYSGHGSQTKDLNGDEASGYDQTWVSYDSRLKGVTGKDKDDVLDDEINAWLAAISAKTDHIIFISDSCHSATVSRGRAPISRGLARVNIEHSLGNKDFTSLDNYQGVYVGAAQDDEFAAETIGTDNKSYGLFTWHWARALQQVQVGETWSDVFERVYTPIVSSQGDAQRPYIAGQHHRAVFGEKFSPLKKTVLVTEVLGKQVKIQAGAVAGMTVGSIYQAKDALLEITQVEAFKSSGKITQGTFKPGDLLVEKKHAYHFETTRVHLSTDFPEDKPLLQNIQAAFIAEAMPGYVLSNDPYKTDLHLHLLRPKRKNGQAIFDNDNDALPQSFPNEPPELWVLTPEQHLLYKNLQIKFDDPDRGLKVLKENLNKLARIRDIKALESRPRSATSPVVLQSYLHTPVKTCSNEVDCVDLRHGLGLHKKTGPISLHKIGEYSLKKNDILTFTLQNHSNQDYYCYLINIGADGAIITILPSARVKAGETWEVGDTGMLMMVESGEETLKFITSIKPFDVMLLEQARFKRGSFSPLEHLLVNSMHGVRGLTRVENVEWVTGQGTFKVK